MMKRPALYNRFHLCGARSVADKAMLARTVEAKVLPAFCGTARFKTVVDSTFPLKRVAEGASQDWRPDSTSERLC